MEIPDSRKFWLLIFGRTSSALFEWRFRRKTMLHNTVFEPIRNLTAKRD